MKSIFEWRILEAMKGASEIPDGYQVRIIPATIARYPGVKITIDNGEDTLTSVSLLNHGDIWIPHNQSKSGWGPLGYDLSIEYATMKGSCVVPATGGGFGGNSQESMAVWKYYYEKRADVNKKPYESSHPMGPGTTRLKEQQPWLFQQYTKSPTIIQSLKQSNKIIIGEAPLNSNNG